MSDLTYEASVYKRTVKYRNFKGEVSETELFFALDPLQLLSVINEFAPKTVKSKSGNPAKRAAEPESDFDIEIVRQLAIRAAGFPSDDGESWEPFEDFGTSIAGKAFLTKLASSDGDRREFAEKVILDPFRTFVSYTKNDPTNTKQDIQMFETMLAQLEKVFAMPTPDDETLEDRRERLAAELRALGEGPITSNE